MTRLIPLIFALALVAACSDAGSGPAGPPVGGTETICNDLACVEYPSEWQPEVGETFISFTHPSDPSVAVASLGAVDMRGVTLANDGTWPTSAESVVRHFWDLIGSGEDADLESVEVLGDGTVRSQGTLDNRYLWFRLIPTSGPSALGIEVRAANEGWQAHADVFLLGVVPGGD